MKTAKLLFWIGAIVCPTGFNQAQVYTPPTNSGGGRGGTPQSNNTTIVNQGGGSQGNQQVVGNYVPYFDPTTDVFMFDGKSFNVNDNRVFRARFEKHLNAQEASSSEDLAYRAAIRGILDTLSPHNRDATKFPKAVAQLQHASQFKQDARLCESLANAVYRVFLAQKSRAQLDLLNRELDSQRREAKIAARKKAEEARDHEEELARAVERSSRGSGAGFFARLGTNSSQYKSKGHDVYVNRVALASLSPSNAKIEVDLSEQKARIYKTGAGEKQLAIETQVSTGKSGHSTPTGSYRIQEKKVEKRFTLYGSWQNSSGSTVRSSGEAWNPPAGESRFVGAEMPYWMRVNGGIGMHVGYVPNYPASHGCIRVPSAVQPLIFSKVRVGTQVTITH